jgi:lipopolysaccharide/colanic/teichoic acid biosynthesis glycosyltransferase
LKTKERGKEGEKYLDYRIGWGKRLFDVVFSTLALIFFSPLLLLIALAIKLESRGAVIYSQKRVGTGYDIFTFYKFRTMVNDADKELSKLSGLNEYLKEERKEYHMENGNKVDVCPDCERLGHPCSPILFIDGVEICENQYLRLRKLELLQNTFFKMKDDPRITKVGRILRQLHFDEIPQFYNVLRGDMSVVGNRPLPLYEAEHLTTDEWSYRFMAPAGITGLWQIRSTEIHNPEERIALDNQYAMIAKPWTDFKIVIKTIITFFSFKKPSY